MSSSLAPSIASLAARLILEEGLNYGLAKHKAARALGSKGPRDLPSNEDVEDAVREEISLFHAQSQPQELAALRRLALRWMRRLEAFNPHLAYAVWRGTANRQSTVCIELYADDTKGTEIALVNLGIHEHAPQSGQQVDEVVLTLLTQCDELDEAVALDFIVLGTDALRGALKPDSRGRSWRGSLKALEALLAQDGDEPPNATRHHG